MSEHDSAVATVQELYRHETDGVRPHSFDEASARTFFADYLSFVGDAGPARGRILDLGCGSGWSTWLFREAGFDAVGVDLARDFEVESGERLRFATGNATNLPFENASFDVIGTYQMLEHVADPRRALNEIDRVLRPGGRVRIVGPNLVTPLHAVRGLLRYVWKNRPLATIVFRRPGMPRHPSGNTLPELIAGFSMDVFRLATKLASREASFSMRVPDTRPPFHADNDACYRCNPIDLARYFERRDYQIERLSKPGRPAWVGPLAGGTWFGARKRSSRG
jgi:SAM-dependent methyltransferase